MTPQEELNEAVREMLRVIYSGKHREFTEWSGYDLAGHARQLLDAVDRGIGRVE